MKYHTLIATMLAVSVSSLSAAQAQPSQTGMSKKSCQNMMKGMDMKGMNMKGMDMHNTDAKSCQDMMNSMNTQQAANDAKTTRHEAIGTVKSADPTEGTVTLAHGPVKSLNWPAMTMGFAVKDKALFDKLSVGKKVDVEIVQQDGKYVIAAVK